MDAKNFFFVTFLDGRNISIISIVVFFGDIVENIRNRFFFFLKNQKKKLFKFIETTKQSTKQKKN